MRLITTVFQQEHFFRITVLYSLAVSVLVIVKEPVNLPHEVIYPTMTARGVVSLLFFWRAKVDTGNSF